MLTHWEVAASAEGLACPTMMAVWLRSMWYCFHAGKFSHCAGMQQAKQGLRAAEDTEDETDSSIQLDKLRRQLDLQGFVGHTTQDVPRIQSTGGSPYMP